MRRTVHTADHTNQALSRARDAAVERPGRALSVILNAISVIAKSGSAGEFREAEILLDVETRASGRHALTIAPLLEALTVAEARHERWIVACVQRRLAWVYDFRGDDLAALEMIERARVNFAALDDTVGVIRSLGNLGVLWMRCGDTTEAMRVLAEALALADGKRIADERARVRVNLGHLYEVTGEFDRGRRLLEEAYGLPSTWAHYLIWHALIWPRAILRSPWSTTGITSGRSRCGCCAGKSQAASRDTLMRWVA